MSSFHLALATDPFRRLELDRNQFNSIGDLRRRCADELSVPLARVTLHKVPMPPMVNGNLRFDQEHQTHILELANAGRSMWTEPDFDSLAGLIEPGFMVLATTAPNESEVRTAVEVPWSSQVWAQAKRLWKLWGRTIVTTLCTGFLLVVIEKVWTK